MTNPNGGSIGDGYYIYLSLIRPYEGGVPYFAYSVSRTPSYIYTKGGSFRRHNQQTPAMNRN